MAFLIGNLMIDKWTSRNASRFVSAESVEIRGNSEGLWKGLSQRVVILESEKAINVTYRSKGYQILFELEDLVTKVFDSQVITHKWFLFCSCLSPASCFFLSPIHFAIRVKTWRSMDGAKNCHAPLEIGTGLSLRSYGQVILAKAAQVSFVENVTKLKKRYTCSIYIYIYINLI